MVQMLRIPSEYSRWKILGSFFHEATLLPSLGLLWLFYREGGVIGIELKNNTWSELPLGPTPCVFNQPFNSMPDESKDLLVWLEIHGYLNQV